ncbi:MAG: hypothetical protein Salg2KO_14400 [Salibacteraceae bacterium]
MKNIIIITFLLSSIAGSAQITKAFDFQCNCTIVTNRFDNGKKSSEYHENEKGQKHGLETVFYAEGGKQYERNWSNGKLDGTGTHYHRNGAVYYKENYNMGVKTGLWSFMDDQGNLMSTIEYGESPGDEIHKYYHAGINYLTQTLEAGKLVGETVHNQEIYDQLKSEAESEASKKK